MPETTTATSPKLLALRQALDAREQASLSGLAALSRHGLRRRPEELTGDRQSFAQDVDRILHSRAYARYIDKTQVFYMVANDHITHRVLHVQLVSKIARTIGRYLGLNEDLIEAVALGHDIGHAPFGHDGERILAELCGEHDLPPFQHNVQSVLFLEGLEKGGQGWNLTLQTLDGILCHDGEVHRQSLQPAREASFAAFDAKLAAKSADPKLELAPMTLEGCVVRFADTISYIGRDIEDAIELGLISRDDLPAECRKVLGRTNGTIVYRLVTDLAENGIAGDRIHFSPEIDATLQRLKKFNYERIYLNPVIKRGYGLIRSCYRTLFETFLDHLAREERASAIFTEFLDTMGDGYRERTGPAAMVRDFIAGMTDNYFLAQAARLGCEVPERS
ncbi:MAG: HD domain-containing protein [Desulfobacteraceae bacterium]|nr:HD domain-containing protein [Desulfobacteraceae bacterium]